MVTKYTWTIIKQYEKDIANLLPDLEYISYGVLSSALFLTLKRRG